MEEKVKSSLVKIENRKNCILEGVSKIDSFDDKEFLIDTVEGYLHIKGSGLSLGNMNMEEGLLTIQGKIDSLTYLNKTNTKEKNFFKKLFK